MAKAGVLFWRYLHQFDVSRANLLLVVFEGRLGISFVLEKEDGIACSSAVALSKLNGILE